jgi:hypothetical protein
MYPSLKDCGYLRFAINDNKGNDIYEVEYRLTGYVFEDNDNILSKKECDHISRFTWNNKSDNIRWVISLENIGNQERSKTQPVVAHKQSDIDYLKD